MKKIILLCVLCFFIVGCKKTDDNNLVKEIESKINSSKNYKIIATLDIFRNEDKYSYDIESTYKKNNYFKVKLINKQNNHEQIILKDESYVYVLTPSLNKIFKFQSEWPYNNSQIYLLQPIIKDIKIDKNKIFEIIGDNYIITSKVNYSNEKDFQKQKVYFDKEKNITKIEVLDEKNNVKMSLNIVSIEYNIKLDEEYFNISKYQSNISDKQNEELENKNETSTESSKIAEILYPMYVPQNTYLLAQDVINTAIGERVILTFSGDSKFTFVQENALKKDEQKYINGEPYLILDTVGTITDSTISWISNDIEYSIISDTLSIDELLMVAQSIKVETITK